MPPEQRVEALCTAARGLAARGQTLSPVGGLLRNLAAQAASEAALKSLSSEEDAAWVDAAVLWSAVKA